MTQGCRTYEESLAKLPEREFKKFSYSRTGNVTATSIFATGAKKEGNAIVIDQLKITTSNPFFGAVVEVEGYKREIATGD